MKTLRILAVAVIAMAFFGNANAQVVVRARIGAPVQHRTVVVQRHPVYRRQTVVVDRPGYRRVYNGRRRYYNRHSNVVVLHPRR